MDNTDCKLVLRPELVLEHKPELARKPGPEQRVAQQQEPLLEPEPAEESKLGKIDRLSSNLLAELCSI